MKEKRRRIWGKASVGKNGVIKLEKETSRILLIVSKNRRYSKTKAKLEKFIAESMSWDSDSN